MTIGERIKQARKAKGLTQKQLGDLSNTSEGTVRQYEIGKRQPRLEQLQAIAAALGVPTVDLLGPYDGPPLPGLVDGDKMEEVEPFHYSPSQARANAAMNQMNPEGQGKVADYAEDILPRYRRQDSTPPSTPTADTPGTEPPPESPENAG